MIGSIYRRDFRDVAVSFYNGTCNCWSYVCIETGILFNLLIDFKQVDILDRKCQYEILREFRILKKLVNLVRMALTDSNCKIKIQGQPRRISEDSDKGGMLLWTIQFNIYLEKAIRNSKTDPVELFSRAHIQWLHITWWANHSTTWSKAGVHNFCQNVRMWTSKFFL